jgi:YesN/AraC family two-component response regulator
MSVTPEEYTVLLCFDTENETINAESTKSILKSMRGMLHNYMNINITAGISSAAKGIEKIPELFAEARSNAGYRYLIGKGINISGTDIAEIENKLKEEKFIRDSLNPDNFSTKLKNSDYKAAYSEIDKYFKRLGSLKFNDKDALKNHYLMAVFPVLEHLNAHNINISEIFETEVFFFNEINSFETHDELSEWIQDKFSRIFEYLINSNIRVYSRAVYKAVKYIKQNYHDAGLSLKKISKYTGLNSSHFSYLFSKEVGMSFKEYLIYIRMSRAKKLLKETNLKIYEICEKTGYRNTEHFSRAFKKFTGFCPRIYK